MGANEVRGPLVALENTNCTTIGGEFDLRQARANRTEEALGKFAGHVSDTVGVGLQVGNGLVIDGAGRGLRV